MHTISTKCIKNKYNKFVTMIFVTFLELHRHILYNNNKYLSKVGEKKCDVSTIPIETLPNEILSINSQNMR